MRAIGSIGMMLAIVVAGCAPTVPPPVPDLLLPASRFMQDPPPQPVLKPGDDAYLELGKSRSALSERNAQVRVLLRYIRLIHKKQKRKT